MSKQAIENAQRINAFLVPPEKEHLTIVGLDTDDGPEHPLYDERIKMPIDPQFVELMLLQGFTSVVKARKNGDKLEVVYGRRRVRHAREANKLLVAKGEEPIRCEVRIVKDQDANLMGLMIAENSYHESDGPLIQAEKLARFLARGRTEKEAAIVFKCTLQTIKNLQKLLDLDPVVRRAVERGAVSASAAGELSAMSRDDQKLELDKLIESGGGKTVTTKAAKSVAKAKKNGAEETVTAPGKRLVTKILNLNKEKDVLNHDFVAGVLWVLGEKASRQIKGLVALEHEVSGDGVEK